MSQPRGRVFRSWKEENVREVLRVDRTRPPGSNAATGIVCGPKLAEAVPGGRAGGSGGSDEGHTSRGRADDRPYLVRRRPLEGGGRKCRWRAFEWLFPRWRALPTLPRMSEGQDGKFCPARRMHGVQGREASLVRTRAVQGVLLRLPPCCALPSALGHRPATGTLSTSGACGAVVFAASAAPSSGRDFFIAAWGGNVAMRLPLLFFWPGSASSTQKCTLSVSDSVTV